MPDPLKQPRVLGDFQGPLAPVTQCDVDGINVVFAEELESWFNAGVACCDECFEDFRSYWPRTAEWDTRFQECSIDIDSFMSGSRLSELYGPAELSTLRHYLECERCGHFIEANLWAFEHCFGSAADFEPEIKALGIVSRRTPFLLLESPFARRVLDAIRSLAATAPAQKIDSSYYRARRAGECATVDLLFFGAPPRNVVEEGRYNHAAQPVLYLADAEATALREVMGAGHDYFVAELRVTATWKVLDLVDLDELEGPNSILQVAALSSLMSAPRRGEDWVRDEYVFTRFVADCARDAGFHVVRYGSTKAPGTNSVILGASRN